MAGGPALGLKRLNQLPTSALDDYPPYHPARTDMLARLGDATKAVAAYARALSLTQNGVERAAIHQEIAKSQQS